MIIIQSCVRVASYTACTLYFTSQLEQKYRLLEKEKLAMESEVSKLRASPLNERDSPFDMVRSSTMISDYRQRLEIMQSRVKELEAFIVEQVTIPAPPTPQSSIHLIIISSFGYIVLL